MCLLLCYDFIICFFVVKSTVSLIYLNSDKTKNYIKKQECQIDRQKDRYIDKDKCKLSNTVLLSDGRTDSQRDINC
jgi:hypothetical protein